jgi:hypothetical protein
MACGSVATARVQLAANITCEALLNLLSKTLGEELQSSRYNDQISIWSRSSPMYITYDQSSGIYTTAQADQKTQALMKQLNAALTVKAISRKAKITSSRRTANATILKVRV